MTRKILQVVYFKGRGILKEYQTWFITLLLWKIFRGWSIWKHQTGTRYQTIGFLIISRLRDTNICKSSVSDQLNPLQGQVTSQKFHFDFKKTNAETNALVCIKIRLEYSNFDVGNIFYKWITQFLSILAKKENKQTSYDVFLVTGFSFWF